MMKRERLMSGQVWYFEEDGFSVKLDLVVDIWSGVKKTSRVMIGGLWYEEETVQNMISGRKNNFYETTVTDMTWNWKVITSDLEMMKTIAMEHLDQYCFWEPVEKITADIIEDIGALFDEREGTRCLCHGTWFKMQEIVQSWHDIRNHVQIV